jgi:hypothetical protein
VFSIFIIAARPKQARISRLVLVSDALAYAPEDRYSHPKHGHNGQHQQNV